MQSMLSPVAYLAGMGLGLGSLIDERNDPSVLGAPSYAAFVAPALAVAANMQTGVGHTAWPLLGALTWDKAFHAMAATPVRIGEIAVGFLAWVGARMLMTGVAFVAFMAIIGAAPSAGVLLVPPVAALAGLAFAAPMAAFTATQETDAAFSPILRFAVIPLFLLGGVFFPIADLPDPLEQVVRITPLWHGVAAARELSLGTADLGITLARVGYLVTVVAAATAVFSTLLARRLRR